MLSGMILLNGTLVDKKAYRVSCSISRCSVYLMQIVEGDYVDRIVQPPPDDDTALTVVDRYEFERIAQLGPKRYKVRIRFHHNLTTDDY